MCKTTWLMWFVIMNCFCNKTNKNCLSALISERSEPFREAGWSQCGSAPLRFRIWEWRGYESHFIPLFLKVFGQTRLRTVSTDQLAHYDSTSHYFGRKQSRNVLLLRLIHHPGIILVLRGAGITLEKFFVFGRVAQLGEQAEHGLGHRALGESTICFAFLSGWQRFFFFFPFWTAFVEKVGAKRRDTCLKRRGRVGCGRGAAFLTMPLRAGFPWRVVG